jgi:hypothetical protein
MLHILQYVFYEMGVLATHSPLEKQLNIAFVLIPRSFFGTLMSRYLSNPTYLKTPKKPEEASTTIKLVE